MFRRRLSAGASFSFVTDKVPLFVILSDVMQTGFFARSRIDFLIGLGAFGFVAMLAGRDGEGRHY